MTKSVKITLIIFFDILASIGVDCIFGFIIGGRAGASLYIVCFIGAVLFSFLCTALLYGIKNFKSEKFATLFFVAAALFFVISLLLYSPLNYITSPDDFTEYECKIEEIYGGVKGDIFSTLTLKKENAELVTAYVFAPVLYKDEGDTVTVREKTGGFGYMVRIVPDL